MSSFAADITELSHIAVSFHLLVLILLGELGISMKQSKVIHDI